MEVLKRAVDIFKLLIIILADQELKVNFGFQDFGLESSYAVLATWHFLVLLPMVLFILHLLHSDLVLLLDVGIEHLLEVVYDKTYLLVRQIRDAHYLKEGL
jgi:hypothetical protein